MTCSERLSEVNDFRTGLFGWLLIVLTVICLPVFVVAGFRIFADGTYPRFVLMPSYLAQSPTHLRTRLGRHVFPEWSDP